MVDKGYIKTYNGAIIMLKRGTTPNASLSATEYLPETKFKVGISNVTPDPADTNLIIPIPILSGTVCDDGSNTFTGSSGGENSTDNTSVYKTGAQTTDNTAQNLIANGTNATKIWTIANLAAAGVNCDATKYIGKWLYIKDATTLAKFKTSGTCLEFRIGVDSTTNYYSKVYTAAELAIGWNWLGGNGILSTWTVAGTPGTLNDYQIRIITNNATDEFVAGDVVYDLLRQWQMSDVVKSYVATYPSVNTTTLEVTKKAYLNTVNAVGFYINGYGDFNEDTSPLMGSEATITARSKSDTDEIIFTCVERIIL